MIAFVGTSPYHIFNAINFKFTVCPDEPADLFIGDTFINARETSDNIRSQNIFEEVFFMELKDKNRLERLIFMLTANKKLRSAFKNKKYSRLYFTGPKNLYTYLIYNYTLKYNPHITVHFLDEGIGTYVSPMRPTSKLLKAFLKYSWFKPISSVTDIYVYAPELMQIDHNCPVKKLPRVNRDNSSLADALSKAFGYSGGGKDFSGRAIYFEQPISHDFAGADIDAAERHILSEIHSHIDNLIVKMHPRSSPKKFGVKIPVIHQPYPFEVACLNADMDDTTLITIASTAVLTPKLLFDMQPSVILLYKLFDDPEYKSNLLTDRVTAVFEAVRQLYSPARFFIPASIEELETILISLKEAKS